MKHERKIIIPLEEASKLKEILSIEEGRCPEYKDCETIATYTAKFDDGIEADIKLCNGDTPYVDAVLFHNGCEVAVLEVSDTLDGEYAFTYNNNKYIVSVEYDKETNVLEELVGTLIDYISLLKVSSYNNQTGKIEKLQNLLNRAVNLLKLQKSKSTKECTKKIVQIPKELREELQRVNNDEEVFNLGFVCRGPLCLYTGYEEFYERLFVWAKYEGNNIYTCVTADSGNCYCTLAYTDMFIKELLVGEK